MPILRARSAISAEISVNSTQVQYLEAFNSYIAESRRAGISEATGERQDLYAHKRIMGKPLSPYEEAAKSRTYLADTAGGDAPWVAVDRFLLHGVTGHLDSCVLILFICQCRLNC